MRVVKRSTVVLGLLVLTVCAALAIVVFMLRPPSSIQSAKAIMQVIPAYPGAYLVGYMDSDSPNRVWLTREYFCSVECATYDAVTFDHPDAVLRFYQDWFISNGWALTNKDVGLHWNLFSRSKSYFRGYRFKGFDGPFFGAPWFEGKYETADDGYPVTVKAHPGAIPLAYTQYGQTYITIRVYREPPPPSRRPKPSEPAAVPTAPGPAIPLPVSTPGL